MTPEWLGGKDGAALIGLQRDAVERRAIPWQDTPVRYKVRFKEMRLDPGKKPVRRYFRNDILALLHAPRDGDRGPNMVPRFK